MKCNQGTDLVCTYWEKCTDAKICKNVPKGIKSKLCETRRTVNGKKKKQLDKYLVVFFRNSVFENRLNNRSNCKETLEKNK